MRINFNPTISNPHTNGYNTKLTFLKTKPMQNDSVSFGNAVKVDEKFYDEKTKTGWKSYHYDSKSFSARDKFSEKELKDKWLDIWFKKSGVGYWAILAMKDVHIYLDKNQPQVCILTEKNKIKDIMGASHHLVLFVPELDAVKNYIKHKNLSIEDDAIIKNCESDVPAFEKAKMDLVDNIKNLNEKEKGSIKDVIEIFNYFEMGAREKEGGIVLERFKQPSPCFRFKDLGINEEKLLENVLGVRKECDFTDCSAKILKNFTIAGDDACFSNSQIESTPKLEKVWGDVIIDGSKLKREHFDEVIIHGEIIDDETVLYAEED